MKKKSFGFTFVVLVIVMAAMLSASPAVADDPGKNPVSLSEWMNSLPRETRVQFIKVFEQNMRCWETMQEEYLPDFDVIREAINRDLQAVLTPGQFKTFIKLWDSSSRNMLDSAAAGGCDNCLGANFPLNQAYGKMDSAISKYNNDHDTYCEAGTTPDKVLNNMIFAKGRISMATQKALEAYWNGCDCFAAQIALNYAYNYSTSARYYILLAQQNTNNYCPGASWANDLSVAYTWLLNAVADLRKCRDECCN